MSRAISTVRSERCSRDVALCIEIGKTHVERRNTHRGHTCGAESRTRIASSQGSSRDGASEVAAHTGFRAGSPQASQRAACRAFSANTGDRASCSPEGTRAILRGGESRAAGVSSLRARGATETDLGSPRHRLCSYAKSHKTVDTHGLRRFETLRSHYASNAGRGGSAITVPRVPILRVETGVYENCTNRQYPQLHS